MKKIAIPKVSMRNKLWLILLLLTTVSGSPYYYREDKHHSEQHKEVSYSSGSHSSPLSTHELNPQKYYESSHFSTQTIPERYYNLQMSPTYAKGFSQYGGEISQQSFHQNTQENSQLNPFTTTQTLTGEEIKPGTYVIKKVIYRKPLVFTQTGYYSSNHNLEDKDHLYGQREKSLYDGQHEEMAGQKQEAIGSLYDQKSHLVNGFSSGILQTGQNEESLYNQHLEHFSQGSRGDLEIGQHPEKMEKTITHSLPTNGQGGYRYYEKRVVSYGQPPKGSSSYMQSYKTGHQGHNLLGNTNLDREEMWLPKQTPNTYSKTFEHSQRESSMKQEAESSLYGQINKENSYGTEKSVWSSNSPITSGQKEESLYQQPFTIGQQSYTSSMLEGQKEESLYGGQTPIGGQIHASSLELGQKQESLYNQPSSSMQHSHESELELGQKEESSYGQNVEDIGQHSYKDSLEVGQKEESLYGGQTITGQIHSSSLEIGKEQESLYNQPSRSSVQHNHESELELGQKEERFYGQQTHNIGQHSYQDSLEIGQREERLHSQQPVNIGQQSQTLEEGQMESLFGMPASNGHFYSGFLEIGQQKQNAYEGFSTNLEQSGKPDCTLTGKTGQTELGQKAETSRKPTNLGVGRENAEVSHGYNNFSPQSFTPKYNNQRTDPGNLPTLSTLNGKKSMQTQRYEEHRVSSNFKLTSLDSTHRPFTETRTERKPEQKEILNSHNVGSGNVELGQQEEQELEMGQMEESSHGQQIVNERDILDFGQQIESSDDLKLGQSDEDLNAQNTKFSVPNRKISHNSEQEMFKEKFTTINQGNTNRKHQTSYDELQRRTEELVKQLGVAENSRKAISKETKIVVTNNTSKENGISPTEVYSAEIQELLPVDSELERKRTWETHSDEFGLNYPLPAQKSYSKKHSKQTYIKQDYTSQPISQSYRYQEERQHSSRYSGIQQHGPLFTSGERSYVNDQPIQRTQMSATQASSPSGSSQDRQKLIGDFLTELDKDIARTDHQQRNQQGTYSQITPYTSQSNMSYHSVSSSSHTVTSGSTSGSTGDRSWYQKIGDKIGSTYTQAKEKAKEIVKNVKDSVGITET